MKKKIVIVIAVLVLVLAAALIYILTCQPAQTDAADMQQTGAADVQPVTEMVSGLIVGVTDEYFVIEDAVLGQIQVNFGDESVFDGLTREELAEGMFVFVDYNGQMTRSLPPQIYAQRVYAFMIAGEVTALEAGDATIKRDDTGEEIILHLPENAPQLTLGQHITAATNGAMTMSLPAQMTAAYITVAE